MSLPLSPRAKALPPGSSRKLVPGCLRSKVAAAVNATAAAHLCAAVAHSIHDQSIWYCIVLYIIKEKSRRPVRAARGPLSATRTRAAGATSGADMVLTWW